jgi:hypothetical protein
MARGTVKYAEREVSTTLLAMTLFLVSYEFGQPRGMSSKSAGRRVLTDKEQRLYKVRKGVKRVQATISGV